MSSRPPLLLLRLSLLRSPRIPARCACRPRTRHGTPPDTGSVRSGERREGGAIPRRSPRRIAVLNEKGGSGKTTLVASLAAHAALARGRRVLAIDMDPQGQLGKVLGVDVRGARRTAIELLVDAVLGDDGPGPAARAGRDGGDLPILPTRIPRLDVVVAHKALGLAPAVAPDEPDPTGRLRRRLDAAPRLADYDTVLVDGPPSFGLLTLNVLRAVDEVVVPVPLTFLALDGCAEIARTIESVRARYAHPALRIAMVVPTFHRRTRLAEEVLATLARRFPKELAQTVLGWHVKIDEAQARGLSVFEYAPRDRGALALAALAEELDARAPATTREPAPAPALPRPPAPAGALA